MTTPRPEPTPEHLAHTTFFSLDDWQDAYNALGDRPDWPEIASWSMKALINPKALPGWLAIVEPRPVFDESTFDRIAENGQVFR
jgi:hypothetical protein